MSITYVEQKIRQALDISRGNETRARQQVIAWCAEDPKLLLGLAAPHLTGIVAHALTRVMNHKELPTPQASPKLDIAKGGEFGIEILKSIAGGDTARFGQESSAPPVKKQAASQRHIDAIKQMAGQSKTPKKF
jgi:hypothetical protein